MRKLSIASLVALALAWTAAAQNSGSPAQQPQADKQSERAKQQSNQNPQAQNNSQQGSQANAGASASASANASANAGPVSLSSGTTVNAELATSVDARHAKPGQKIIARTTQDVKQDGKVILRKGTKLIAHVTQAQAYAKGQAESTLGIAFDSAVMKNGQEVPFHAAIQALAAARSTASAGADDTAGLPSGGTAGSRGASSGVGGALGGAVGAAGNAAGGVGQTASGAVDSTTRGAASVAGQAGALNAGGQLTSTSTGVIGLQGLNLASTASSETQGSLITSSMQNVHLSSGTQMLLRVTGNQSNQ